MTETVKATTAAGRRGERHIHHGRTGAAWTGSIIALIGFIVGGVAMVPKPNWTLFWISAGILALSLVATKVMQALGFGAK